jgi:cobalt-zinc-cadmium efflux system membrane fusion protein
MNIKVHALCALLALGCKREVTPEHHDDHESEPSSHEHEGEHGEDSHEALQRKVKLSEKVLQDAKIVTTAVTREQLSQALTLAGEISADPDQIASISSPAAGRIEEVKIKEGEAVKKGQVLVTLRVPEIGRVRSTYAATSAKASAARANAQRVTDLLGKGLASEQEALDAKAEAASLEVEAASLKDQLGAIGAGASGAFSIALRAPLAGVVVMRNAVIGQPVSPEQTLGTIAALDEVWFLGRVFEKDLGRLQVGAAAEVRLNAYPNERFLGSVEYLGQQVDPNARAITARVRLKNRENLLRIGLFGSAQISLGASEPGTARLVVPRSAITEIAGKPVVFVKEAADEFELHSVTLGQEAPGKVEVLEGLREGEVVVSDGVFTLKSLVLKGSFAEDEH